jgi:hypothetical protein
MQLSAELDEQGLITRGDKLAEIANQRLGAIATHCRAYFTSSPAIQTDEQDQRASPALLVMFDGPVHSAS